MQANSVDKSRPKKVIDKSQICTTVAHIIHANEEIQSEQSYPFIFYLARKEEEQKWNAKKKVDECKVSSA